MMKTVFVLDTNEGTEELKIGNVEKNKDTIFVRLNKLEKSDLSIRFIERNKSRNIFEVKSKKKNTKKYLAIIGGKVHYMDKYDRVDYEPSFTTTNQELIELVKKEDKKHNGVF